MLETVNNSECFFTATNATLHEINTNLVNKCSTLEKIHTWQPDRQEPLIWTTTRRYCTTSAVFVQILALNKKWMSISLKFTCYSSQKMWRYLFLEPNKKEFSGELKQLGSKEKMPQQFWRKGWTVHITGVQGCCPKTQGKNKKKRSNMCC